MSNKKETQLSDLRLEKNIISESIFKINDAIDFSEWYSEDDNELEVKLESNFGLKRDDPSNARVILTIEIFNENFELEDKPFYCLVKMIFFFSDKIGDYSEDSPVIKKFGLNMISIAYPYIRAYISTLSSISGIEQIHIPAINVYSTFNSERA
ncbi:hypothetical protein [Enterococcus thailandicus]|uniref:hypothetical protein n=1 Tax=Enterococcus thailandicus TaxID=417368 RepID=UPI00288CBD85|nr:hypothetical protein [Enterococcus thailandicus]MDT2751906.1 hypothetical protein [Enterococcus thailandicus]MDT2776047.1 hypothetical protein [Enterococcus thailandicus]